MVPRSDSSVLGEFAEHLAVGSDMLKFPLKAEIVRAAKLERKLGKQKAEITRSKAPATKKLDSVAHVFCCERVNQAQ